MAIVQSMNEPANAFDCYWCKMLFLWFEGFMVDQIEYADSFANERQQMALSQVHKPVRIGRRAPRVEVGERLPNV